MDHRLLEVLACPACHQALDFCGETNNHRIVCGEFRCPDCRQAFPVEDEVPVLVLPGTDCDGAGVLGEAREPELAEWIPRNFARVLSARIEPHQKDLIDAVRASEGPIIDIATGPEAFYCIQLMSDGRDRQLVMSDLGKSVMKTWRSLLREKGWGDRCSTLVFDARRLPFANESIPTIMSSAGFSNVVNGPFLAIAEAARVLRKGGMIYALEASFEREGLEQLCKKTGEDVHGFDDWVDGAHERMFLSCGLTVVRQGRFFRQLARPGEEGIGAAAQEHGVEVWMNATMYWVTK